VAAAADIVRDEDGDGLEWWLVVVDVVEDDDACVVCLLGCCEEAWMEGDCWRKAAIKEERKYGR